MTVVVGSGVSGLTCAAALVESGVVAGDAIEIWAKDPPQRTTSSVAAAFWYPFRVPPHPRVVAWARTAYARFAALARSEATGVSLHRAFDMHEQPVGRPWWADAVSELTPLRSGSAPAGLGYGWSFDAPVVDTRRYLPWLQARVEALGVRMVSRTVERLEEATAEHDVVINCAGLGAREICGDRTVIPVRGQLLYMSNPGLERVLLDEHRASGPAYVVPRADQLVIGATVTPHDEDLRPRPAEAADILARCTALYPALAEARHLETVVGLRPTRPEIRVEAETTEGGQVVVHDYGHGGAGVTLSWGCAAEVVELVREALGRRAGRRR